MNKLSIERQAQVIKVLCEGNSIRSTARITDSSINTVVKLLKEVGAACLEYQDRNLRHLSSKRIECDEIWNFCYAKEANVPEDKKGKLGYGDIWTFVGIDAESKLLLAGISASVNPKMLTTYKGIKDRVSNIESNYPPMVTKCTICRKPCFWCRCRLCHDSKTLWHTV